MKDFFYKYILIKSVALTIKYLLAGIDTDKFILAVSIDCKDISISLIHYII